MDGAKYIPSKCERGIHELKEAGHLSFFIGKDMSYVDQVNDILNNHICMDQMKTGEEAEEYVNNETKKE